MISIYKYELSFDHIQTIRCRVVKILTIQIQSGRPVAWIMISDQVEERDINIIIALTGENIESLYKNYFYIATIQDPPFVYHWFTNFLNS